MAPNAVERVAKNRISQVKEWSRFLHTSKDRCGNWTAQAFIHTGEKLWKRRGIVTREGPPHSTNLQWLTKQGEDQNTYSQEGSHNTNHDTQEEDEK